MCDIMNMLIEGNITFKAGAKNDDPAMSRCDMVILCNVRIIDDKEGTMKITTFNPQIITKNAQPLIELMEELGFEISHKKQDIGMHKAEAFVMKDANGFKLDISQSDAEIPHDITCIRMNVDDFDETYSLLISKGFENYYGNSTADTPSSKSAVLRSPTGFVINLVKHIVNTPQ